ncbi:MAG TPA: tyrosine-type recombinase/integrase, partial [Gemmatales bacterium]|nr:tyrosine-type recombinase/integrase [Gemmatales bacterium]
MASISKESTGRRIQFFDQEGKRRGIYLPGATQKQAESICIKVEHLLIAKRLGTPLDGNVAQWIEELSDDMNARLAAVGLVTRRETSTLGKFIDDFLANRRDIKPGTRTNLIYAKDIMVEFFGFDRPLHLITRENTEAWLKKMIEDYAPATASRMFRRARQFFNFAMKSKMIRENPFAGVVTPQQVNKDRQAYISREDAEHVLEACPDNEWKLIFALSRFAGLRCPSEHYSLRWADIDWEKKRILVQSPKTGNRWVPLFPEVKPYLEWAFSMAEEGAEFVINRLKRTSNNLRTQMTRIIKRAGLKPWPRLFHNLRASCETELVEKYPLHVVSAWLGHSAIIANKHYLQVRDDHFRQAASHGAVTVQNAVQHSAVVKCNGSQVNAKKPGKTGSMRENDLLSITVETEGNYPVWIRTR